jgi:adenylosuccinate synthase
MSVTVIVGAQWGDEGKGKLVDVLSDKHKVVMRYQGGANAGHTVHVGDKKYVLHLIPGGILRDDVICLIGNGVVVDPLALFEEIEFLAEKGISVDGRLFISDRAHIIMPYHRAIDRASEAQLADQKIGTTGRGIGPAYIDKASRCGIRFADLSDTESLPQKIRSNVDAKNKVLVETYHQDPIDADELIAEVSGWAKRLAPFISDTADMIYDKWKSGADVLLEGAQGCLLDVDYGTYPFVTSSNPTSGGATIGTGLPPRAIDDVIGVMKAYVTRVGSGPFPSEELNEMGDKLRALGNEFGATTGRPRRCGWFDAVAARYSARINGLTSMALTKVDVLDAFDEIKICTGYKYRGEMLNNFPAGLHVLSECKPVFETMPGWKTETSSCRKYEDLPEKARAYIARLEQLCEVKASYVSVGVDRDQIIPRR